MLVKVASAPPVGTMVCSKTMSPHEVVPGSKLSPVIDQTVVKVSPVRNWPLLVPQSSPGTPIALAPEQPPSVLKGPVPSMTPGPKKPSASSGRGRMATSYDVPGVAFEIAPTRGSAPAVASLSVPT